jgi:hypothetical protein
MPSRLRLLSCFYLFVVLVNMSVLAQSGRVPLFNQTNGLPVAQQPHPEPRGLILAKQTEGFQATTRVSKQVPTSGLNFAFPVSYDSGGQFAYSVAAGDVNGDGKVDVIVANYCASSSNCTPGGFVSSTGFVGVLLGVGDGTFRAPVIYNSGGQGAYSVAVGDVNGDGKLDVLVANYCAVSDSYCAKTNGIVSVLLGNGDGTLQTAVVYDSGGYGASSIAIADVNGDGKLDVLVANTCGSIGNCLNGEIGVLVGNGDGSFQAAVTYGSGAHGADSVSAGDVNGDGKLDLVVANNAGYANSSVGVMLGNGDGSFQTAVTYDSGGVAAYSVVVADLNGDGKPDLLVTNYCADPECNNPGQVGRLLGNGDGTFQAAVLYGSYGVSVAVGNLNIDANPDFAVAGNSSVAVQLGNGDGTFQTTVNYGSGGYDAYSVVVADVNGDGKPDLIVANQCNNACSNGSVGVLINNSVPTTTTGLASSPNPSGFEQEVTLTANITSQGPGTPTGTVTFLDGGATLGASSLNGSGVAILLSSTLAVGTHSVVASYSGDTNFAPSTSQVSSQVVQGAVAQISQTSLSFGSQAVGTTSTAQSLTLMNVGNIALTLSIGIIGTNSSDFVQTNNCGTSVPANGSCNISVTFTPMATGSRNGVLSIDDNAPNSPQTVSLHGVGVGAATITTVASTLNPATYGQPVSFSANVTSGVGNPSGTVQFNLDGSAFGSPVTLISGSASSISTSTMTAGTHTVTAVYSGAANFLGSTGTLNGGQVVNSATSGTVVTSTANPSTFGQSVTFTATINGQYRLLKGGVKTPDVTGSVKWSANSGCGTTAVTSGNPGVATCTTSSLAVGTDAVTGAYSGDSNHTGSMGTLSQVVQGAIAQVSPTSLNFGNQTVGIPSASQKVTLSNTGNISLSVTSISIRGSNPADFAQTNTCGNSVVAGGNCTISATFSPTAVRTRSATISITDNAPGNPQKVSLTGVGVTPSVTLSPTSLTFPTQVVFTISAAKTITLTNTGAGLLTISKIVLTGQFNQTNTCGASVAAGGSCTISVRFKPTAINTLTGSVSITDNASGSPQSVSLTGVGTYVQLTPTSLNFGNQPVGTKSLPKKITLSNKGSVAVNSISISIAGTNKGDFAETNTCGTSVKAGGTCTITTTFAPAAKGKRTGSVSVSDDGGGSPQRVSLSGTGT